MAVLTRQMADASITFSAGCIGGLANALVVWVAGAAGLTAALSVSIAPSLTSPYLYQRIVWGGLWGFLFLLPWARHSVLLRGIVYSLGPTLVQLLVVFPFKAQKGFLGSELGVLTPCFVVLFNAVWGIVSAAWAAAAMHKPSTEQMRSRD